MSKNSKTLIEEKISQSLLDSINSVDDGYSIIVFNNDFTPFEIVLMILCKAVPLNENEAFQKTYEIHEKGSACVYSGSKIHCYKIASALSAVKVDSIIEKNV